MQPLMFLIFFLAQKVIAFPDTIRHGYTNCTSCHVSPSGGGMMNSYGRSLSRELLSTWGRKGEESLLHGYAKLPEEVLGQYLVGGDARYLSRKQKSKNGQVDEGFLMQAQLRLGFIYEKFKFLATIGKIENPRQSQEVRLVSPEYYAIFTAQESLYVRAGRFEPVFGLRLPDHNIWIKSDLGFVPWNERDSIEMISEGEKSFLSLAGFQSLSTQDPTTQATGYSFTYEHIVFDTTRIGVSALNSEGLQVRKKVASFHGVVGWSEHTYTMFDYAQVWNTNSSQEVSFFRTGHEIFKGVTPYLQYQTKKNLKDSGDSQTKSGFGLIWLPRPHFELVFQKETAQGSRGRSEESYLLLHYYL